VNTGPIAAGGQAETQFKQIREAVRKKPLRFQRESRQGTTETLACFVRIGSSRDVRIALNILGALLTLLGTIWFLQGINILPGSFMTGQIRWAVYGGIAVVIGIGLLVKANRGRPRSGIAPR
jgi:hypothetical protein